MKIVVAVVDIVAIVVATGRQTTTIANYVGHKGGRKTTTIANHVDHKTDKKQQWSIAYNQQSTDNHPKDNSD